MRFYVLISVKTMQGGFQSREIVSNAVIVRLTELESEPRDVNIDSCSVSTTVASPTSSRCRVRLSPTVVDVTRSLRRKWCVTSSGAM